MSSRTSSKNSLRVAYFTTGWPPEVGGPSSGNVDRVRHLSQHQDMDIHVIVPQHDAAHRDNIPQTTIHMYEAKPWPIYPFFRVPTLQGGKQVEKMIADIKPDVVINTDVERGTFLSSWRRPGRSWASHNGSPYIGYYHTDFYGFAASYRGWNKVTDTFLLPALRALYRSPDLVIAASDSAELEVEKLHARRVERLAFDGVDTQIFTPEQRDRSWLRTLVPTLQPDDQVVLSFGRLAPEKKIDHTLEAFDVLMDAMPPERRKRTWLLVVGEGDCALEEKLKLHAARLRSKDQIFFHGFLHGQDRAKVLASVDAYTLPSIHETFSVTTTEAMACGTPVVCARSGAMPTYLTDHHTGFLHDPLNPADQARAIRTALDADRNSIGTLSRAVVTEKFSHTAISTELRDLLHRELMRTTW
ncbi:MAG: glycosyltransferase [Kocuria sp.]|nr:glycosyltransferase [Kocuria sp.]